MKCSSKIRRRPNTNPKRGAVKNTKNRTSRQTGGAGRAPGDLLLNISPRDDAGMREFYCMAVHPTQPLMAVGDDGGVGLLHINSTPGEPPSKKFIANAIASNSVTCLAFHPVHPLLACASFTEVALYRTDNVDAMLRSYDMAVDEYGEVPTHESATRLTTATVLKQLTHDEEFIHVAFHPTELLMAVGRNQLKYHSPLILLYRISPDYSNTTLVSMTSMSSQDDFSRLVFSSDGKFIASEQDATTNVWRRVAGENESLWSVSLRMNAKSIWRKTPNPTSIAFNPRDPLLMHVGCIDGTLLVEQMVHSAPKPPDRIGLHASAVTSLAFSPSGDVLISGSVNGASSMWDYVVGGGVSKVKDLTPDNSVRVVSVAVNVNFIAVCRESGIEIYRLGSRGEKIRPSIRGIVAAIPPIVLPQTEFGTTRGENVKVRVAQSAPEYHEMCATSEKNRDECSKAACPVCFDEFITHEKLAQPVFFHETVFVNSSNGVEKKMWTCPLHLDDMNGLVKRGTVAVCPYCRKKMDISWAQLETVTGLYKQHQKLLAHRAEFNAPASRIGRVFKGHLTRKSSPGKAVASQIKGIYASKIGRVFKGHLTRKSLLGKKVAKRVAREKEYSASRKAFSQEYHKRKVDAVLAIAKFTGHSPDSIGVVFEEQFSRSGGDFDEAVRATTELLFAKSRQQSLADPNRLNFQRHRDNFFATTSARAATVGRISEGSESENAAP
jgi:hypothetical protein